MTPKEISFIENRIEQLERIHMVMVGDYPDTKLEADTRNRLDARIYELKAVLDYLA